MISWQNDVHKQEKVGKEDDCLGILIGIPVGKAADFTLYSHLSNKREVTLTDFEKKSPPHTQFPPPRLLIS